MPHFDPTTPTVERKFLGKPFTAPLAFSPGHVLTAPETTWVNSQLISVVGNAFSGDIRRALEARNKIDLAQWVKDGNKAKDYVPTTDAAFLGFDLQAEFDAKFDAYTLGESNRGSGGGANGASPINQLIRSFSVLDIKQRLAAKGFKVGPLYKNPSDKGYKSKWEELVEENIKAKGDQFRAMAEAQAAALADEPADDLLTNLEGDLAAAA